MTSVRSDGFAEAHPYATTQSTAAAVTDGTAAPGVVAHEVREPGDLRGPHAPTIVWGVLLVLAALGCAAQVLGGMPGWVRLDAATALVAAGAVLVGVALGLGLYQRGRRR